VLDRQEPPIRQFLLDTCLSDRLTADLAWELSGREDAGAILDQLERSNSFTVRFGSSDPVTRPGSRDGWERYFPNLREYLAGSRRRLRRRCPGGSVAEVVGAAATGRVGTKGPSHRVLGP
jgi:ATP/maltotriose-dependent transcriptional regulator MalT